MNFILPIKYAKIILSCTHFDDDAAFIITQCNIVGAPEAAYTPHSLHAIVQCAFQAVSARVPNTHSTYRGKRYCFTKQRIKTL